MKIEGLFHVLSVAFFKARVPIAPLLRFREQVFATKFADLSIQDNRELPIQGQQQTGSVSRVRLSFPRERSAFHCHEGRS